MSKNNLSNLNECLFKQLERLGDVNLSETDKLEKEIKRSTSISKIASTIIANGRLILDSQKHFDEYDIKLSQRPDMLSIESGKSK